MNIKAEQKQKVTLPSPLFRDPIYDCPTDPTVIWNEKEEQWYLLYTQRRATDVPIGVSWVHGTALGVATSRDGTKWLYRGTLEGLDIEPGHNTFWALLHHRHSKRLGVSEMDAALYFDKPLGLEI